MKKYIFLIFLFFFSQDFYGDTLLHDPLYQAIAYGKLEGVKQALANGADVNKKTPHYEGYLLHAAANTDIEIFKLILRAGADPYYVTEAGENLLNVACINPGSREIIKIALDLGVNMEQVDKYDGYTPMLRACSTTYINWPAAKQLIEAGCNIQALDKLGRNALMIGILSDMQLIPVKFIDYLLEKGIKIDAQDNEGRTALMYTSMAVEYMRKQTLFLLEQGADITIKDIYGNTALHYLALASHQTDILSQVAKRFPNINIRNADGATPLTLAREHYNKEAFAYLQSIGGVEKPVSFQIREGDKVYGYYDGRLWVKAIARKVTKRGIQVEYDDKKMELLKEGFVYKDQFPYFCMLKKGTKVLARNPLGFTMAGRISQIEGKKYRIQFIGEDSWNMVERVDMVVIE